MTDDPEVTWTPFDAEPDIVLNETMARALTKTLIEFGAASATAVGRKDDEPVAVFHVVMLDDVERFVLTAVHCDTGKAASWEGVLA